MSEWMVCPKHSRSRFVSDPSDAKCRKCGTQLLTMKELWDTVNVPSLDGLLADIDKAIMEFIWTQKDGTLMHLFLYFNVKSRPLNPREFLQFWDSLKESEEDYYMTASAEALRNEAGED